MLEQFKKKRLQIEQSVGIRKNQRQNMSSVERRRLVQIDLKNYNQLMKTMQDFSKFQRINRSNISANKTQGEDAFKQIKSQMPYQRPLANTPTLKDILPMSQPQNSSALANEFYQLSADPKSQGVPLSPEKYNQINFFKKQFANVQIKPDVNIENLEEHASYRDSEPQIPDQQIKIPQRMINNSGKTSSVNNSQAIFFTSQFKQFLNNDPNSPVKVPPIQIKQTDKMINHQPSQSARVQNRQQQTARWQKSLKNNASGQSLQISNESSLKFSFNQSGIHDIISKKISNQLVMQSIPNSSQTNHFRELAIKLLVHQNVKDVIEMKRIFQISQLLEIGRKVKMYDLLRFNKEYRFELKKNDIKVQHFLQNKKNHLIRQYFSQWSMISKSKKDNIAIFQENRTRQIKQKCFKTFKMLLFDRRINSQIDNYFLSKIFFAFKKVTQKQSKRSNQKAFKLYFKNLKKRMFYSLIQGCYNSKRQYQIAQAAQTHYYLSIIRKYFEGWKHVSPRQQRFVRISMTTKNILKQTADNRLLQTRTFDFYEVK